MSESLHQYVLDQLDAWRGEWSTVAAGSGVSLRTIEKVGYRTSLDPRVSTVEKLAAFFRTNPRRKAA